MICWSLERSGETAQCSVTLGIGFFQAKLCSRLHRKQSHRNNHSSESVSSFNPTEVVPGVHICSSNAMGLEAGGGGLEESGFYSPRRASLCTPTSLPCLSFRKPVLDNGPNQTPFCIFRAVWELLSSIKGTEEQTNINITARC